MYEIQLFAVQVSIYCSINPDSTSYSCFNLKITWSFIILNSLCSNWWFKVDQLLLIISSTSLLAVIFCIHCKLNRFLILVIVITAMILYPCLHIQLSLDTTDLTWNGSMAEQSRLKCSYKALWIGQGAVRSFQMSCKNFQKSRLVIRRNEAATLDLLHCHSWSL